MRLIDADALLQRAIPHGWSTPKWVSDIMINDAPTVDAVPVVVCSKCKYDGACVTQSFIESEGVLPFDRDTWFCADGERREEEKDV